MKAAGQRDEVLERADGDELRVAADLDEAAGIVGIDDEEADLRVRGEVAALAALEGNC